MAAVQRYFINAHQCRHLEEFMQKVRDLGGVWSPRHAQVLKSILSRGQTLLDECSIGDRDLWLQRAVKREENKETFSLVLQDLLEFMSQFSDFFCSYYLEPHHKGPYYQGLYWDIVGLVSLKSDLPSEAAKDRSDLLDRVNNIIQAQSEHEEDEVKQARFLQGVLKAKTIAEEKKARQINAESIAEDGKTLGRGGIGGYAKVVRVSCYGEKGFAMKGNCQSNELDAMLGNRHANVMPMIAYYSEPPTEEGINEGSKVLMDLMDGDLGKYLSELSKQGKRTLPSNINTALQIARGLNHMHGNKIAHRDLKPGNILYKCDGNALENSTLKIADFGSSRSSFDHRTDATAPIGTGIYMAPELLCVRGLKDVDTSKYGPEVDIYSFAMICYNVFTGLDPSDLSWQAVLEGKRPPLKASASCPQALVSFIHKCWHQDPNERPSASQVYEFLNIFKYLGLLTTPTCEASCLSYGITDTLLEKLVSFLGKEWLEAEARAISEEGTSEDDKKLFKQVTEFLLRIPKKSLIQHFVSLIW